ncbi:MAG: hypothetical protein JW881_04795 [Spirochaetales bacterium]|nr:hypothetical protein [Spirochaetales bacterium]
MIKKVIAGNIVIYLSLALAFSVALVVFILAGMDIVIQTMTGIAIFLLIIICMFLFIRMKSECREIKEKLKVIPEKGLSYIVELNFKEKGTDEIGQLSHHLNLMLQEIKKVFWDIKENLFETKISISALENIKLIMISYIQKVVNIGNVRQQFESICNRLSIASSSTKTILGSIIDLANQTSHEADVINKTSEALTTLLSAISVITDLTLDKHKMAEELKLITQRGGEKVKNTSDIITVLNENTDEMLKIIEIINHITESTNILSINAGIEAAHAGIHGKGFRVIADEIMKLVDSTRKNAGNISRLLHDQINNINIALSESHKSGKTFSDVSQEVESAANTWIEISNKAQQMADQTKEIQDATERMLLITKAVQEASTAIKQNVEKINLETHDLDEATTKTLDILEKVTVTNEESKQSTVAVLNQLNEIGKFVTVLNKSIDFFNLGKKVYFLFPDASTVHYIDILLSHEIEAFAIGDHSICKPVLKEQKNSLLFINCDNIPSRFQFSEFVKSIARLPELKGLNIGLLTSNNSPPFPELGAKQKCEYIVIDPDDPGLNARTILSYAERHKARGLRKQIRVDCEEGDAVSVDITIDKRTHTGRVENISSAALLCYIEEDIPQLKNMKRLPVSLMIKGNEYPLVCRQSIGKKEHYVILIYQTDTHRETFRAIKQFIRQKIEKHFEKTIACFRG